MSTSRRSNFVLTSCRFAIISAGILFALASSSLAANFYTTTVESSPGFIANFPFTPATGANSTGAYSGSFLGGASIGPTGSGPGIGGDPSNTSLQLDGVNASVVTDLLGGISGQGTILAWINMATLPSVAGHFFSIAGESALGNDFDLQVENDNLLKFYTDGGSSTVDPTPLGANQWYFIAATFVAGGPRDLYVNGVSAGTGTAGGHGANSAPFYVGQSTVFSGRHFDGGIAQVAVFNQALSGAQVADIYAAASVPEPSSLALASIAGLSGALLMRRRRKVTW